MTVSHPVVHAARIAAALVAGISMMALAPPAGARTVRCGERITASTRVSNDLTCPSDALVVGRDGITIDLGGHRLAATARPAPASTSPTMTESRCATARWTASHRSPSRRAQGSVTSARVVGMRSPTG